MENQSQPELILVSVFFDQIECQQTNAVLSIKIDVFGLLITVQGFMMFALSYSFNTLYIQLALLLVIKAVAASPSFADSPLRCPGQNTLEMQACAAKQRDELQQVLAARLSVEQLELWLRSTREVCRSASAAYRDGSIYGQLVIRCEATLHQTLLTQFKGLDQPR